MILGPGHRMFAVVSEGRLVAYLPRKDAAKVHAIQFGLTWIYGMNYAGKHGKSDKSTRDVYEYLTYEIWDLQPNTQGGSRKKRAFTNVQELIKKVNKSPETA